jgi:hypothetical protein
MDPGVLGTAARDLLPVILALAPWVDRGAPVPPCPPCPALACGSLTCSGHAYSGVEPERGRPDLRCLAWVAIGGLGVIVAQHSLAWFRTRRAVSVPTCREPPVPVSENELRNRSPAPATGSLVLAATPSSLRK